MKRASFVFLACNVCFGPGVAVGQDAVADFDRVRAYGAEVHDTLVNKIFREFTGLAALEEKYKSLNLAVIERDRSQIVNDKVSTLKKIFKGKESMVKRIAQEAEKLRNAEEPGLVTQNNLTFYDKSLDGDQEFGYHTYRNAKCNCNHQRPEGVSKSNCTKPVNGYLENPHFGRIPVSYESTSVHIPTEEFNGDPDVLKDIYLGRSIDDVMKSEVCNSGEFSNLNRWVYYTTRSGAMRYFPDRFWTDDCNSPDVYDSRTAAWFLNSVSSSKDVLVLIDNSGSVKGLTLNLLYRSVKDLLDTLTTNDYVNIALFNEEANFINHRCRRLLQATPRNKQILRNWMYEIETKNQAFYDKGFDLALRTLNETHRADVDAAKCNPTVLFFTDGDSVYPTAEMERWNNAGEKRVFSFIVGKSFYGKGLTKEIACRNRGYYSDVPSFTATKSSVHKYLVKISEPLADSTKKTVRWTLPYKDKLGIGVVLSVSTPVYENSDKKKVAGVVGTDLLLADLKKIVTEPGMGYDYYPFLVDNNGFAVIHPNLIEANHDDIIAVDFLEVEHSNVMSVRNDVVDGKSGSTSLAKDVVFDKKYVLTSMYNYDYAPVDETVFKFGLGVHVSRLKSLDTVSTLKRKYPGLTVQKMIDGQASDTTVLLYSSPCVNRNAKRFNPCETGDDSEEGLKYAAKFTDGLPLSEVVTDDSCEITSQLFSGLLLHGSLSDEVAAEEWEQKPTLLRDGQGLLAIYASLDTPSFVRTGYMNFTEQTNGAVEKDDELIKKEIERILANPHDSDYMRRAIHKPDWTIYTFVEPPTIVAPTMAPDLNLTSYVPTSTFYETATTAMMDQTTDFPTTHMPPFAKRYKPGYILASKAVRVAKGDPNLVPVVTGVVLHPDTFQRNIFNLGYKCDGDADCKAHDWDLMCNDTENIECLILDDGGFLLASNQRKHYDKMNKFFGLIDGELMRTLVNGKVYDMHKVYDYQAFCTKKKSSVSAGIRSCFVPTIADLLSLGWWLSSCARMFFWSSIQNLYMAMWALSDLGSPLVMADGDDLTAVPEYCIQQKLVLSYGSNSHGSKPGAFDCTETCTRSYTLVRMENTNLLLIVAFFNPACMECTKVAPFVNEEIKVTVDMTCNNDTDRHRNPPDNQCYDARTYPEENDGPCSSAKALHPLNTMTLISYTIYCIYCQFIQR